MLILLEATLKDVNSLTSLNDENTSEIKTKLNQIEIALSSKEDKKGVMNFEEWFDNYEVELENRKLGKKYVFNNFLLDTLVPAGPNPGEIGLIVSSSGSGKSTLVLNQVSDLIDMEIPCMYFSLEMSSIATLDRLCSKRLGIPYSNIVSPNDPLEYEAVLSAIKQEKEKLVTNKKFRFSEDATISLAELYQHIKKFQADIGQEYCIVIIDLLSMITDFSKTATNMPQQIEISINKLSAMVKSLGVHCIGVLQYNRSTESEAGKIRDVQDLQKFRPNRAQVKNSNAYLERARFVLSTWRAKMYAELYMEKDEILDMVDIIEVSVVKANNSVIGKRAEGLFIGDTFSIEPFDDTSSISTDN